MDLIMVLIINPVNGFAHDLRIKVTGEVSALGFHSSIYDSNS